MKKCKGCGVELQTEYPKFAGYALNNTQEYCQRCFRLTHYGDLNKLESEVILNDQIIDMYRNYNEDIFVLIIDAFDFLCLDSDDLLDIYKDKKIILVINKIDLLPRSIKDEKMEDLFRNVLSKCNNSNIINCLLTYKNDFSFNDLFFEALKETNKNRFIFVGRVNAGKTTIINKLLKSNDLTVSTYPGTTISSNEVECNCYTFVDTPGLIDESSLINKLNRKDIKELIPSKCVKPKIFQLYDSESYIIEGLIRIDIVPKRNASIAFNVKNELDVHRAKLINATNYIDKHKNEFKLKLLPLKEHKYAINKDSTFYIKGLGFIRIIGNSSISIWVHNDIKIYKCEVVI